MACYRAIQYIEFQNLFYAVNLQYNLQGYYKKNCRYKDSDVDTFLYTSNTGSWMCKCDRPLYQNLTMYI